MRVILIFLIPLSVLGFLTGMIVPRVAVPWHRKPTRIKVALYYIIGFIGATILFLFGPSFSTRIETPPTNLTGRWMGSGPTTYFVWIERRQLHFDLEIHDDGTITGTAGGAAIEDGSLWNREIALVWLGHGRYIGRMQLSGPLIAEEDVVRDKGWLMFDLMDSVLVCSFTTDGVKAYADKETGVVATGEFTLRRSKPR